MYGPLRCLDAVSLSVGWDMRSISDSLLMIDAMGKACGDLLSVLAP